MNVSRMSARRHSHTTSKTWALRAGEPFRYLGFHIPLGQRCSDRMPKFSTFMIGAESEVAHIRPALLWPCCTSEAKPFLVKQIPLTDQGNRPSITAVFGAVTASPSVLWSRNSVTLGTDPFRVLTPLSQSRPLQFGAAIRGMRIV